MTNAPSLLSRVVNKWMDIRFLPSSTQSDIVYVCIQHKKTKKNKMSGDHRIFVQPFYDLNLISSQLPIGLRWGQFWLIRRAKYTQTPTDLKQVSLNELTMSKIQKWSSTVQEY